MLEQAPICATKAIFNLLLQTLNILVFHCEQQQLGFSWAWAVEVLDGETWGYFVHR